ncbi:MAG TPA: carboxypeptidase-like regulatory domain-containing protein [Pyrinomonadaceae bacterium]|nr:carboxypeptidase-like regulatory domain-containing protein [Pyrinomonadaceae bacterium]
MKKLLVLTFLLLVFAEEGNACTCAGTPMPCEAYWKASAVFLGTVTYTTTSSSNREEHDFYSRVFRFTVDKAFRGVEAKEVEVLTGSGGGDCGYGFQLGGQYVVYAYRDKANRLVTSICSRTRPSSEADTDLSYFKDLSKLEPGGTIFGEIKLQRRNDTNWIDATPLKGVKLLLVGRGRDYETLTDEKGKYKVSGVQAGTYRVRVSLPEGTSVHREEQAVEVSGKGCAQASFWLEPDTRVTGKVLDSAGLPAADVLMELIPIGNNTRAFGMYVRSDSEGRYEMKLVAPGRYLLGVRIAGSAGATYVPFPQTFYPGVSEKSEATIITLSEGQQFEANDLILPPRFVERQLNGIVLDASGQPVRGATVWLKEIQYKDRDMPYSRETDQDGRFTFPVFEGVRYRLNAYLDRKEGPRAEAPELQIVISSNPETIKLVLR